MTETNSLHNIPKHVAIIMDGNGRYAKSKDLPRIEGHRQGVEVVENIALYANDLGIKYLTLYAFSKENWQRPQDEVNALMSLLTEFLALKKDKMIKNGIQLNAIGDLSKLPEDTRLLLQKTIDDTSVSDGMVLTLALSYGSRDEILRATQKIVADFQNNQKTPHELTQSIFSEYLDTTKLPDPDFIIRTSGEMRISNFLLWQGAYAEYKFVDTNWPEFTPQIFLNCLLDYQNRERRFGLTSEQIES